MATKHKKVTRAKAGDAYRAIDHLMTDTHHDENISVEEWEVLDKARTVCLDLTKKMQEIERQEYIRKVLDFE